MTGAALHDNRREIGDQATLAHNHAGRALGAALRLALLLIKAAGLGLARAADLAIQQIFIRQHEAPRIAAGVHPRLAARALLRWKGMA